MIQSTTLDKFGIILSGVCMVHCLVAPVIVTLLPILSLNVLSEHLLFHTLMLWLVLPTSCIALFLGCRKHKKMSILATGILGMSILVIAAIFGHDIFGERSEKIVITIGGMIIALSHYLNFRACQSITCSSKNCSTEHHH